MTIEQNTWIDSVINHWISQGIKYQNGASLELILETERTIGFIFPESVKEFYERTNGFQDWEYNENLFSIWSLERIVKEHNESDDKNFISFPTF